VDAPADAVQTRTSRSARDAPQSRDRNASISSARKAYPHRRCPFPGEIQTGISSAMAAAAADTTASTAPTTPTSRSHRAPADPSPASATCTCVQHSAGSDGRQPAFLGTARTFEAPATRRSCVAWASRQLTALVPVQPQPAIAASAEALVVRSSLSEAERTVRPTPNLIRIGVVLAVVLPEALVADLITASFAEDGMTTAGTPKEALRSGSEYRGSLRVSVEPRRPSFDLLGARLLHRDIVAPSGPRRAGRQGRQLPAATDRREAGVLGRSSVLTAGLLGFCDTRCGANRC
jgi:hypothetical protein